MKKGIFLFFLIFCAIVALLSGCGADKKDSNTPASVTGEDLPSITTSTNTQLPLTTGVISTTEPSASSEKNAADSPTVSSGNTELVKYPTYSDKDIKAAEDIVRKYYSYDVTTEYLSSPIDNPGNVWDIPDKYFTDYNVSQVIFFKVTVTDKPPRKFYLGRKSPTDSWVFLTEGY